MSTAIKQISIKQTNGNYVSNPIGTNAENIDIDNEHTLASKISLWDSKVDSIPGKGLSTNDYTTAEKDKLASLLNYDDTNISNRILDIENIVPSSATSENKLATMEDIYDNIGDGDNKNYNTLTNKPQIAGVTLSGNKTLSDLGIQEKENGKGLSTEDYTTEEKTKLDGLSNYDDSAISNRISDIEEVIPPSASNLNQLATMADIPLNLSGGGSNDFLDLDNKPQINDVTLIGNVSLLDLGIQPSNPDKGLSTEDFTTAEKTKLAGLSNYDDTVLSGRVADIESVVPSAATSSNKLATMSDLPNAGITDYDDLSDKPQIAGVVLSGNKSLSDLGIQASESGKGLSANDYTDNEKTKLSGIESGAEVNVIESISVNGTPQTITNKNVDITVSGSGDVPIATASVAGKVKPDGTTITVDENGTITAVGGSSYSTITPSDIDRLWGSSLTNGDSLVYDDIVDGDLEEY